MKGEGDSSARLHEREIHGLADVGKDAVGPLLALAPLAAIARADAVSPEPRRPGRAHVAPGVAHQ